MTEAAWAIVRTRHRCEDIVAQGFLNAGYRAYLPRGRVLVLPHGAQRKPAAVMRALFAGLVFVQDWRGWPQERISQVIGLMPGMRSGSYASLVGADIAALMEGERLGEYDSGIAPKGDLKLGQKAEIELSGQVIQGGITRLTLSGRATLNACIMGRYTDIEVDTSELRAVSA